MENASKALLMAGEVLIAVIILSILAYTFQKMSAFAENYQDTKDHQKIVAFNTQYIKYATGTEEENKYIYSEDVVTLTEKVLNWNTITADDNEKIQLYILDKSGGKIYSSETLIPEFNRENFLDTYKLRGNPTNAMMKEYKFSCKIETNTNSGRVSGIIIQIQGERDN